MEMRSGDGRLPVAAFLYELERSVVMRYVKRMSAALICALLLVVSVSACNAPAVNRPLYILIDIPTEPWFISSKKITEGLKDYLQYVYDMDPEDVEVEFLPEEESERSVRISALRTAIISGEGPDVFVVSSELPAGQERKDFLKTANADSPFHNIMAPRERLFQDPQFAMEKGLFLPLDDYLAKAQFFDAGVIEPAVLAAGQTDEGQMLIPLAFTFPTAIFQEGIAGRSNAEQNAYGAAAWNQFPDLFGQIVDYKAEKLLFSEAELLETVRDALAKGDIEPGSINGDADNDMDLRLFFLPEKTEGLVAVCDLNHYDLRYWQPTYFSGEWQEGAVPEKIVPVKNRENGVTAQITAYIGINSNTPRPKEAFQVLDLLTRREAMGNIPVREDPKNLLPYHVLFLCYDVYGVPSRNDLLGSDYGGSFGYRQSYVGQLTGKTEFIASPVTFDIYKNLRAQVTTARFYGELDWELQEMFNACREAETDEEIEKIVSKAYDTMLMILAES